MKFALLTKEQKNYHKHQPDHCPFCRSKLILRDDVWNIEPPEIVASVFCQNCHQTWKEMYKLETAGNHYQCSLCDKSIEDGEEVVFYDEGYEPVHAQCEAFFNVNEAYYINENRDEPPEVIDDAVDRVTEIFDRSYDV